MFCKITRQGFISYFRGTRSLGFLTFLLYQNPPLVLSKLHASGQSLNLLIYVSLHAFAFSPEDTTAVLFHVPCPPGKAKAPLLCSGELLSEAYKEVLCVSYFAVAGIKPHGHGNLEKEGFVWAYSSGGIGVQDGSKQAEQDTGGSLLKPQA